MLDLEQVKGLIGENAATQTGLSPCNDMLVVIPFVQAGASEIIEVGDKREYPEKGLVVQAGPGGVGPETGQPVPVASAPGDVVVYGHFAGIAFEIPSASGFIRALLLRDSEVMVRGRVPLVMHDDNPRRIHEEGLICEHCPKADMSAERARLLAERNLVDGVTDAALDLPSAGVPVAEEHDGQIVAPLTDSST